MGHSIADNSTLPQIDQTCTYLMVSGNKSHHSISQKSLRSSQHSHYDPTNMTTALADDSQQPSFLKSPNMRYNQSPPIKSLQRDIFATE